VVAIEDLNVAGMTNRQRRLGRALADAGLGELRRQLTYKTSDRGRQLVAVGRFFPSSKTCSACGAVKAKLPLVDRIFTCDDCGLTLDRDVNAARSGAREATRILGQQDCGAQQDQQDISNKSPGYDRETLNADRRPQKTRPAPAGLAAVA
jgi:putative transposase